MILTCLFHPLCAEHPSVLLLSQALKAILLYQKLWPTVLSQAGFDLGKLLSWQHSMNDSSVPPIVLHLTLQILLQSPPGSIKWHHQVSSRVFNVKGARVGLFTNSPCFRPPPPPSPPGSPPLFLPFYHLRAWIRLEHAPLYVTFLIERRISPNERGGNKGYMISLCTIFIVCFVCRREKRVPQ